MTSDHRVQNRLRFCIAAYLPAIVVLAGCGGQGDPHRFDLSGTVCYNGRPVPVGYIEFAPDTTQGNSGPGASADIRDGRYCTLPGRGTIGGPHFVSVLSFDGKPYPTAQDIQGHPIVNPMGNPLFKTAVIKADLPMQMAVYDFEVPKQ